MTAVMAAIVVAVATQAAQVVTMVGSVALVVVTPVEARAVLAAG